jgi:hypothetical protein
MRIPGVQVEISGDYSQLKRDMAEAKAVVRESATGMSDALANALSPQQISRAVNSLVQTLNTAKNSSKLTGTEFKSLGGEMKQLSSLAGVSEKEFAKLQSRMLQNRAAKDQEKAFQALERQLGLTRSEAVRMRYQMGDLGGASRQSLGIMGDKIHSVTQRIFSLRAAILGLGIGYVMHDTLRTAASFETLQISLETVTGSSQAAKQGMAWIEDFTRRTPYELDQVADAFRKLAAYGMEPAKYLGILGDTASAMGKTLDQAVEAFADAARGEFERLKEFGVKAKTEGDKVTFSWVENGKRLTKEVQKNEIAISDALAKIWSRFEGGMERRMDTWEGLWSNLMDQWSLFQKEVMNSGPLEEMKRQLKEFLDYLGTAEGQNTLRDWAKSTGEGIKTVVTGLERLLTALGRLKDTWDGIPTPLKGMLIGGAVGGVVGRHPYAAAAGAAMGLGAGLAEWSNEKSGGHKPPSQLTLQDIGLPNDADINAIFAKVGELEGKAKELQERADKFWQDVLQTTAPGTGERDEKFQEYQDKLREVAAVQEKLYRLLQMDAGHTSGVVKKAKEEEEATDKIIKARTKLANDLELLGASNDEKERIRLEQQLQENLKTSSNSYLAWQVYYAGLAELREKDLVEAREAEEKRRDAAIKADVSMRDTLERLAEQGLTDKERELRELERRYKQYYEQLDDWLDKWIGEFADTEEETTRILEEYNRRKLVIDKAFHKERQKASKSELQKMLEDWANLTKGWDQIAKDFLTGLQQNFFDMFRNTFEGIGSAWDNLWQGMKNIAYQAIAAIMTKLASAMIASGVLSILPGLSGILGGMAGQGKEGAGGGTGMGLFSGIMDWFKAPGTGGLGGWLTKTFGTATMTEFGAGAPTLFGVGAAGWNAALGAAGLGALGGGLLGPLLFGGKGYSTMGSTLGGGLGAGAASLLATAGLLPITGPLAPILGGLLGGLGGGFLGSLFGGDGPSSGELGWQQFQQDIEKMNKQDKGKMDLSTYLDTFRQFHQSDNRAAQAGWTTEAIEKLMREKMGKDWQWWMPTAETVGNRQDFEGTQNEEYWKRATTGSLLGKAFGGEAGGKWAADNQDQINDILKDLPTEDIERLGESMSNLQDAAGMFGMSLEDLFKDIDFSKLKSGEWSDILKDRLAPASLMARMEDEMRAQGIDNLTIATQKQTAIIDTLLGSFNMGEEDTNSWIDQLFNANAQQADLAAKMKEYQDIIEQLKNLRAGEEDKAKDLITRGRQLREELGLGESAFNKVQSAMENIAKSLNEKTLPALEKLIKMITDFAREHGDGEYHHGGLIRHSGGLVDYALASGLITPHGGTTRMHTGGLRPDERWILALRDEYVMQPNAVRLFGLPYMEATNRGDVGGVVDALARRMPAPAMNIPAPNGGEGGRVVQIHINAPLVSFDGARISGDPEKVYSAAYAAARQALEDMANSDEQPGATAIVRASL